jgi:hypothetical protein
VCVCACARARERERDRDRERQITELLSVVLYGIRSIFIFDFRLVTDETPNKWQPANEGHAVLQNHVLIGSIRFTTTFVANVFKVMYPRCAGQLHFLSKIKYKS